MSISSGITEGAPVAGAIAPAAAVINTLTSRAAWQQAHDACRADPGRFHGDVARSELHWFEPSLGAHGAWIR